MQKVKNVKNDFWVAEIYDWENTVKKAAEM